MKSDYLSMDFESTKQDLLASGKLFFDTDFPPLSTSLKKDGLTTGVRWRRPTEISQDPKFTEARATRFDLDQGELGDCWFIAGAACLAVSNRKLFDRCVPKDQSFEDGSYAGIFHFFFWHFDTWKEVIIDDYLPTRNGRLIYAYNREQPDEFWPALMEKAYAKLYGCYENIEGGHTNDALVDFTGGISEVVRMKDAPEDFFSLMYKTLRMNSMVGCSINVTNHIEEDLGNGLYSGHAYSVTNIVQVHPIVPTYQATVSGEVLQLIRLRNPWGRSEWKGAWSDHSLEWRKIPESMKKQLGLIIQNDGEFWMSFKDFMIEFDSVSFCHLYPDALTGEVAVDEEKHDWRADTFHNEWIRGYNAGGCGNSPYQELFWINPQYGIRLRVSDDSNNDGKCTLIVSLIQKAKVLDFEDRYISFFLYKLRSGEKVLLDGSNYSSESLYLAKAVKPFTNLREVTARYSLSPGYYVIIPCTFQPNKEFEFLLRVYTETDTVTEEVDTPTVIKDVSNKVSLILDAPQFYS